MEIALYHELKTFIKVWLLAILSASYCYLIPKRISNGYPRLLSLIPAMIVFSILPLSVSIVHLKVPTVCYLAWYANFKLALFAFNRGPLASTPPLPFFIFISIALFPIKHRTSQKKISNSTDHTLSSGSHQPKTTGPESVSVPSHRPVLLAFKAMIFAMIVSAYQYKDNLNKHVLIAFYCCHIFLATELTLAITAFFVGICLGFKVDMDPQFNEPYLATSLQDFWGRRWNLMVTSIFRPTIYDPIREMFLPIFGKYYSRLPAVLGTFMVSGLIHEVLFVYFLGVWPTWEVTWLFVLHGVCTCIEVAIKKAVNGRFRLHRLVSGPITVAFVVLTSVWLFLPQLLRNGFHVQAINECLLVLNFVKSFWE